MFRKTHNKRKFKYGIKNKIILFFTIFTVIPLSVVGFVSLSKTSDTIISVLSKYIEQATQTVNAQTSVLFDEAITLLNLGTDYRVRVFMNSSAENDLYQASKELGNLYNDMRTIKKSDSNIFDITVIGSNGNCYSERNGFYHLEKSFDDYDTVKAVLKDPRRVFIFQNPEIFHVYPSKSNVISFVTSIFRLGTNDVCGIIKVDMEKSALIDIFSGARWSDNSIISILDEQGSPVFQDNGFNGLADSNIENILKQNSPNGHLTDTIDQQQYLIVYNTLQAPRWKIIMAVPQSDIMLPVYDIRNVILLGIAISLLLAFIINTIISNSLTKPIMGLKKMMKQASSGDFDVIVNYKGKDEISELYESFDKMVKKIITTRPTGGLHKGYKPMLPASA